MKKTGLILLAILALAALLARFSDAGPFEEQVVRAEAEAGCPVAGAELRQADATLVALCGRYGLPAYFAGRKYPQLAPALYATYGTVAEWPLIVERYGSDVLPVVRYFIERGSLEFQFRQTLAAAFRDLSERKLPGFGRPELTPEQFGLIAISEIDRYGHEFLREFEIVDGVARRRQLTRVLSDAKHILIGGVIDLEKILARGERLPRLKEMGSAALDAVLIIGGPLVVLRAARPAAAAAGTAAVAAGSAEARLAALGSAGLGAGRALLHVARKAAPAAAVLSLAYISITRPQLIASAGGWIAEQLGLAPWIGVFAAWAAMLGVAYLLLRTITWPVRRIAWPILRPVVHRLTA